MLPHTDPRSSIARQNVAKTCEQCHVRIEAVHAKIVRGALWEKSPFFLLAIASGLVAVFAQRSGGAVAGLSEFPLTGRVVNALTSYVAYLFKTVWPAGLVPFYPYPQVPLGWRKVTLEWDSGWWFLDFKDQPASCWHR